MSGGANKNKVREYFVPESVVKKWTPLTEQTRTYVENLTTNAFNLVLGANERSQVPSAGCSLVHPVLCLEMAWHGTPCGCSVRAAVQCVLLGIGTQ